MIRMEIENINGKQIKILELSNPLRATFKANFKTLIFILNP